MIGNICYGIKLVKLLFDWWNAWTRKTIIEGSPFYVMLVFDVSIAVPYRMYLLQQEDWMNCMQPIVAYCFISVVVCALYFLARMMAIFAVPTRRVTTALFAVQFMTDVVSVISLS